MILGVSLPSLDKMKEMVVRCGEREKMRHGKAVELSYLGIQRVSMAPLPPVYLVINNNLFYILSALLAIKQSKDTRRSSKVHIHDNIQTLFQLVFFHSLSLFVSFSAEGSRKWRSRKGKEKYTVRNSTMGSMSFARLDIISI